MRWLRDLASRARSGPTTGGDALRAHVAAATGARDPFAFGFGDFDVLAYRVEGPLPHYLYVTFGLSRVQSPSPVAGTQTELTMRTPAAFPVPYAWPAEHLAAMVRDVRSSGQEIAPGHYLRLGSSIPGTARLAGFTFVADPLLGFIEPRTGRVRFTYAVGVTEPELEGALSWDPVKFTGMLGDVYPLGLTDPDRADALHDPQVKSRLMPAAAEAGASIGAEPAKLLRVAPGATVDLDARAARALLRAARYRLRFSRPFALVSDAQWLKFDPALDPGTPLEADGTHVLVPATDDVINELLATFDAAPGTYRLRTVPLVIRVADTDR